MNFAERAITHRNKRLSLASRQRGVVVMIKWFIDFIKGRVAECLASDVNVSEDYLL